jgi:hypothetical protein
VLFSTVWKQKASSSVVLQCHKVQSKILQNPSNGSQAKHNEGQTGMNTYTGICDFVCALFNERIKNKTKLHGLSPRANYTERPPLAGEVIANFCG